MSNINQKLVNILNPDTGLGAGRKEEQTDLYELLASERLADKAILYASAFGPLGSVFVHSVLVPKSSIKLRDKAGFTNWHGNPYDGPSCGMVYGGGERARVEYDKGALGASGMLAVARRLIFARSFDVLHSGDAYYELAQELTHAHGLHWVEERSAWCRLDERGDVEDVARVEISEGSTPGMKTTVVAISRKVLDLHMAATGTSVLQMFDSVVHRAEFHGFDGGVERQFVDTQNSLVMKYRVDSNEASYFRGAQILRPPLNALELGEAMLAKDREPKQHATYISQDFKNHRIAEVSCSPSALASYFERDSTLPLQTSPVFFRPEVLDKYKADPDKYKLESRSITCRNAWYLKTYDFNDAGQVHTMICYLGDLPYDEQLYWKSFNEKPKASISKRSFKTDFQGTFDDEGDPLDQLKDTLRVLSDLKPDWFSFREPKLLDQLHYPLTSSHKGWNEVIVTLAKCVTEGLEKRFLEKAARNLGSVGDPKWGSIKWVEELLKRIEVDDDRVPEICFPLFEVQRLRSKLGGTHASGGEANEIRKQLLKTYGTPLAHIKTLSAQLSESLAALGELLNRRALERAARWPSLSAQAIGPFAAS
ncbi:hypothetical protein [Paraburkholderia sp. BCC1885]|uniref:hypothetical protein n=1 Tax=Paraburkholderia sp. BCC1885 TaxID=2562669 RepID=UPI001183AC57|nr:hypothetical protein [Paraburkholderia sp. BCC1885]